MSDTFKISGKKVSAPSTLSKKWSFEVRPGGWVIAHSSTGERKRVMFHQAKGKVSASLDGFLWAGTQVIESAGGSQSAGSDADLTAQFPGKVRKIQVQEGSQVSEGDSLLLVEAMKMEFAVRAPYSGVVTRILVQEGQQLSPGDQMIEVKAKQGET